MTRHETQPWSVDAAAIDRARIVRGWTRRDLAQQAHIDEGTLCDFFAGRRRPTFGTLYALCQALELALVNVIVFIPEHGHNNGSKQRGDVNDISEVADRRGLNTSASARSGAT